VDDKNWRTTYADLLRQIRTMQRQLTRAQEEAKIVRDRAAAERKRLQSIRTERRSIGRLAKPSGTSEFVAYRNRRKKR
jgi:hypothetical protein